MADMVHCRGCGAEIHRTAVSCPRCGAQQQTSRVKSKVGAGMLAVLLGGLGIHRFYLGQWWGVFYLLFIWTGIPGLVAFIEGLVFLFSSQERWDAKYNQGYRSDSSPALAAVAVMLAVLVLFFMVGILAAIAIPAYQDYTIRAQVSEGLQLAEPVRAAVAKELAAGRVPAGSGVAGVPEEPGGVHVSGISVNGGRVDITFGGNAHARIAGHTLSLTPYLHERDEGNFEVMWRCGYAPVPKSAGREVAEYSAGDIEPRYLPSACRR